MAVESVDRAKRVALTRSHDDLLLDVTVVRSKDDSNTGTESTVRFALPPSVAKELRAALAGQIALADAEAAAGAEHPMLDDDSAIADDGASFPPTRWLTPVEGREFFDQEARHLLGMSGEEFLRRYDAGEFDAIYDDPDHRGVLHLSMLIPFARQTP